MGKHQAFSQRLSTKLEASSHQVSDVDYGVTVTDSLTYHTIGSTLVRQPNLGVQCQ